MIKDGEKIGVLNYNENGVSLHISPTETRYLDRSRDGATPTVVFLTMEQIRYANNYNAFKTGILFFEKNKEKDVYEELNIDDWKNILTNKDIRDIIKHPTYDGLKKIISIDNDYTFERVRAAYHKVTYEENYDISIRVAQIIETRYKEIRNKKLKTAIVLEKNDVATSGNSKEVEDLKASNAEMKKQLEEMTRMMASMMNSVVKDELKVQKPVQKKTYNKGRKAQE